MLKSTITFRLAAITVPLTTVALAHPKAEENIETSVAVNTTDAIAARPYIWSIKFFDDFLCYGDVDYRSGYDNICYDLHSNWFSMEIDYLALGCQRKSVHILIAVDLKLTYSK
jgi:hypothetical protein